MNENQESQDTWPALHPVSPVDGSAAPKFALLQCVKFSVDGINPNWRALIIDRHYWRNEGGLGSGWVYELQEIGEGKTGQVLEEHIQAATMALPPK